MPESAQARRRQILLRIMAVARDDEWRITYTRVDSVHDDDLDTDPG